MKIDRHNLVLSVAAVVTITLLTAINLVAAGPTQAPPNGNPALAAGPKGNPGPQGLTGNSGAPGNTGATGAQGPQGLTGIGACNWNGQMWISHGWDGGCAWDVGAYFYCVGNRLTQIVYYRDRSAGNTNGLPTNCEAQPHFSNYNHGSPDVNP